MLRLLHYQVPHPIPAFPACSRPPRHRSGNLSFPGPPTRARRLKTSAIEGSDSTRQSQRTAHTSAHALSTRAKHTGLQQACNTLSQACDATLAQARNRRVTHCNTVHNRPATRGNRPMIRGDTL